LRAISFFPVEAKPDVLFFFSVFFRRTLRYQSKIPSLTFLTFAALVASDASE